MFWDLPLIKESHCLPEVAPSHPQSSVESAEAFAVVLMQFLSSLLSSASDMALMTAPPLARNVPHANPYLRVCFLVTLRQLFPEID
jgi:hypothetical protein